MVIEQVLLNEESGTSVLKGVKRGKRSATFVEPAKDKSKAALIRQNSNSIGTDTSGAVVKSINNILSGIADSVNRISELQSQDDTNCSRITKLSNTTFTNLAGNSTHTVKLDRLESTNKSPQTLEQDVKTPVIKVKTVRRKAKPLTHKLSTIEDNSNFSLKKGAKMSTKHSAEPKKIKVSSDNKSATVTDVPLDPAQTLKKRFKPYTKPHSERRYVSAANDRPAESATHKLVEIYHNNAAKESDSDDDRHKSKIQVKIKTANAVPPLRITSNECGDYRDGNEDYYDEPIAPRSFCTNKSYELPTIASKMKHATKVGFNMFNFKAIPFCPVMSTTPSHNIGINIQQVMSIIKTRQPVQGISPTLAHNINLAAEKLNNEPLTSFVSSMTSRMGGYGKSACPLTRSSLNYQHLQDLARNMPDDTIEEVEEDEDINTNKTMIISGPSGDMQIRSQQTHWSNEIGNKQCTCTSQSGVEFQQVYNKYRTQYQPQQPIYAAPVSINAKQYSKKNKTGVMIQNQSTTMATNKYNKPSTPPLAGKEKNLKEVLMNLHDDFEAMNKKYELLSAQVATGDAAKDLVSELADLEQQLNKKEEEITIVMTLYKEVLALKEQVKNLKTGTHSQGNVNVKDIRYRPSDYTSKTAHHLTKLLQQIQQYHTYYKAG